MRKESKIFKAFRYLCLSFVVVIGLVAIIGTGGGDGGGGGGGGGGSTPDNTYYNNSNIVLNEKVIVLDEETNRSLISVASDGTTFTFERSTSQLESIAIDDILVFGITDLTPDGALRRVLSISLVGNPVIVTEQATLAETLESGTIDFRQVFGINDIQVTNVLVPGASAMVYPIHAALLDGKGWEWPVDEVIVDGVTLNGVIKVIPDFEYCIDIDPPSWLDPLPELLELTFINHTKIESNLTLSANESIEIEIIERELIGWALTRVPLGSGLWITPKLSIHIGANGVVSTGLSTSISNDIDIDAGISYYDDVFHVVKDYRSVRDFVPPSVPQITFNASAYCGAQLTLLVVDLVGGHADLNAKIEFDATVSPEPFWELYAGIFADIGVDVEPLGWTLYEKEWPLYDNKWLIADSNDPLNNPLNNPPTADISSPSGGSEYDVGDTIIFSGTGDDPEDGSLTGGSLVWTSNRDGQIGTGTYFTRDNLSVGIHTITLTATDSEGATGTDSVSIICVETDVGPPAENLGTAPVITDAYLVDYWDWRSNWPKETVFSIYDDYEYIIHASDPDLDTKTLYITTFYPADSDESLREIISDISTFYTGEWFITGLRMTGPSGDYRVEFQIEDSKGNISNTFVSYYTVR